MLCEIWNALWLSFVWCAGVIGLLLWCVAGIAGVLKATALCLEDEEWWLGVPLFVFSSIMGVWPIVFAWFMWGNK